MTDEQAERDLHRVAVDIVIEHDDRVLLIKRAKPPFEELWCLPGGHVEQGEQVHETAVREAKEETGLDVELQDLIGIYDAPGRDPRGPVIAIAYRATPTTDEPAAEAATDARRTQWFDTDALPDEMGFDHRDILADALGTRDKTARP